MERYAHQNLACVVFNAANTNPDAVALIQDEQRWTYGALATLIQQRINQLWQVGIQPDQHVGLLFYNTIDYVVNFFALLSINAAVVPINVRLTAHEISRIVQHSHMAALLSDDSFSAVLDEINTQQTGLKVIRPDDWPSVDPRDSLFYPEEFEPTS